MRKLSPALLCASAACLWAASAQASTVTLSYEGSNAWGAPAWKKSVSYTIDGHHRSHGAGLFRLKNESDNDDSILAWCIDIFSTMKSTKSYDEHSAFLAPEVIANIDKAFTAYYDQVVDAVTAAAFQMTLWDITVDSGNGGSGIGLGAGRFKATGTNQHYTLAQSWLTSLSSAEMGGYDLRFFESHGSGRHKSQDLVYGTPKPVPLPAGLGLLAAGLAGLGALRARQRKG